MFVAICDDDEATCNHVENIVTEFQTILGTEIRIWKFSSGNELLRSKEIFDVIILDIGMPEMDGIETAFHLNPMRSKIIFLTSFQERFKDGFKVRAFRYLIKPVDRDELLEAFKDAMRECDLSECITIIKNRNKIKIPVMNIYYISAYAGGTEIWTVSETFRTEQSLSTWKKQLNPKLFYQSDRGFLVNVALIEDLGETIRMKNGYVVKVSRRNYKGLKECLINWDLGR